MAARLALLTALVLPDRRGAARYGVDWGAVAAGAPAFGACVLANSANDGLGIAITVTNSSTGRVASAVVGACSDLMKATSSGSDQLAKDSATGIAPFPLFDDKAVTVRITPDR